MTQQEDVDIIVVGAGAAGCVIAARASENARNSVAVIEAGRRDTHPFIHIPAGFIKMIFNENYIWPFMSAPSELTGNRQINILQGRVVGGSASLNGLVYNRGLRSDFDEWAAMGNPGWEYDSVLPYFRRSEFFEGGGDPAVRGQDGPLNISLPGWRHEICEALMEAAGDLGIPRREDYNDGAQFGTGYFQRIIKGRWRYSTARAYLKPALQRGNLRMITNATVAKILFEGRRAVGVEYLTGGGQGARRSLRARKQVVLCSGTLNTARLLQLSGIGRRGDLERIGVPVVSELPGVGQNLRDHYSVRVVARAKNARTINERARPPHLWFEGIKWLLGKPSILTLSPSVMHIFAKSDPKLDDPDLQGVFSPASYKAGFVGKLDDYPGMTCGFWPHKPKSVGHVHAVSTNPAGKLVIQPNYLSAEEDVQGLVAGVKLARQLFRTGPMRNYFDHEQLPGKDVQSDDEIIGFIREYGVSSWHLIGTARMGPAGDKGAVVDSKLCVRGIDGLMIADASVMPTSPSANTFAATVMIAEKAAETLKAL